MRVPLLVQAAEGRSLDANPQQFVNLYLEPTTNGRAQLVAQGTPGLLEFADSGLDNWRALIEHDGIGYGVSENHFYVVESDGTLTDAGVIATSSGFVSLACNGLQVFIAEGATGFIYTIATGVLAQITDPDFEGAETVAFNRGFFLFNTPDDGRLFGTASYDGMTVSALDFATAEHSPDDIVAVVADHDEVVLPGAKTIEFWSYDAGTGLPYSSIAGAAQERGCAAKGSVVQDDNSLLLLGDDRVFYRLNGRSPVRISTHEVESVVDRMATITDCRSFSYTQDGHKFCVWTFPTEGKTLVYDIATQLWHERESVGEDYWRAICYMKLGDKHIVGDAFSGKLYEMDLDIYDEDGGYIERRVVFPPVADEGRPRFHGRVELEVEAGTGDFDTNPQLMLSWSDDGGHSYGNEVSRGVGLVGEYGTRPCWNSLGQTRGKGRVYKLRMTDSFKWSLTSAFVEIG
jgi:hypothetical protein